MKPIVLLALSVCLTLNARSQSAPGILSETPSADGLTSSKNNYYFSTSTGDDSRTAAQAQNPLTPWKTINKLNAVMKSLQPGDAVLFKRDEVFSGGIIIGQSGTEKQPIIFSAYGKGNKPVISGLATLTSWTDVGGGSWESDCSSGAYLNLVVMNGSTRGMGRFPNITDSGRGFLSVDSHVGTSEITDAQLGSAINWTGAEIVVRKVDWVLDRGLITNHSGNTLTFVSPTAHKPTDGYGYFIQNSPLTLDKVGEWYYNPATKKLRMFCGSDKPGNYVIQAGVVDTLVFTNGNGYLTFDNLSFVGADVEALKINNSTNIRIQNSAFDLTGLDAISADNSPFLVLDRNTINHSNNSGIRLTTGSNNASIKNNYVKNSGLIPGMGTSNNQQHDGIFVDSSPLNVIESNVVDSSGYCGIVFTGDYITVKNNAVNYFCLTVNDGGGIYTWGGWDKVGRKITDNVVLNGIGAPAGTNSTTPGGAVGIYTDDRSTHIDITNNSVANCSRAGIYLHNSHEMNINGNTLFNNNIALSMVHDALEPADPTRNNVTTDNIFSSNRTNQMLFENVSMLNDAESIGSFDKNYYARPMDENGIINTNIQVNGEYKNTFYNLAQWTAKYGYDVNSLKSPVKIPAYTINSLVGDNKFPNGNFDQDVKDVDTQSSPGTATATFDNSGKMDGGALKVSFDAASGATNNVAIYLDFGAVTAGKNYVISFSVSSAAAGKTMTGFVLKDGPPWNSLSELKHFEFSSSRSENQFVFTAPTSEAKVMLALQVSGPDCPFWLDNFQVHEANVSFTNPDDYTRFLYNATDKTTSIALDGTYVDVKNKQYSGMVTLNAYSSIFLMKKVASTTSTEAANRTVMSQVTPELTETIATTVKLSPNPAHEKLQVAVDLPSNTRAASVSIYSLSGVKMKTISITPSTHIVPIDVSTFSNGVYVINIAYDGHLITRKFVKQ